MHFWFRHWLSPPRSRFTASYAKRRAYHGAMGSIVEWQSLKMQEYRYSVLVAIARFFELFGVRPRCATSCPFLLGV